MRIIKIFPIKKVQQLRRRAEMAREVPVEGPQGWSKSEVDPMKLLAVFSSLRLKKGLILRAYQFRSRRNGNGIVWAIPESFAFPEPEECLWLDETLLEVFRPPGALDDLMEAIEGDGTPWSYLSASLFAREIAEFGAMWHGCSWSTHVILGSDPWGLFRGFIRRNSSEKGPSGGPKDWRWLEPKPREWRPMVCEDSGNIVVKFYTFSGLVHEAIYRHLDTYKPGKYHFKSDVKVIAEGPGGFIF